MWVFKWNSGFLCLQVHNCAQWGVDTSLFKFIGPVLPRPFRHFVHSKMASLARLSRNVLQRSALGVRSTLAPVSSTQTQSRNCKILNIFCILHLFACIFCHLNFCPPCTCLSLIIKAIKTKILYFSFLDSGPSKRIDVKGPVVELDGDEMTRIIWQMIKDKVSWSEKISYQITGIFVRRNEIWF